MGFIIEKKIVYFYKTKIWLLLGELGLSGVGSNMVTVGPGGPQPGMGILAMMASIGAVPVVTGQPHPVPGRTFQNSNL